MEAPVLAPHPCRARARSRGSTSGRARPLVSVLLALVLACHRDDPGVPDAVFPAPPRPDPGLDEVEHELDDRPPDVLLIVGDDFNWTDLDSVETPNLDQLARRGMTFRRHYSFPVCSPTRHALLFGRLPLRDGIGDSVGSYLPPSEENPTPGLELLSLPDNFTFTPRAIYHTALFGKWHLGTNELYDGLEPDFGSLNWGAYTPLFHGFGRFLAGTMANITGEGGSGYTDWLRADDGVFSRETVHAVQAQSEALIQWWGRGESPRIAVWCPNYPHGPLHAPPPELLPPGYPVPGTARERFEAMLVSLDLLVGRVLERVDLERTYVFFLADNGPTRSVALDPCPPFTSGCSKQTVFEPGIRVPLIVAGPDVLPGTSSDALVSTVDVMATLGELLDAPPAGEDSISFRPILLDPALRTRRCAYSGLFGTFEDDFGNPVYRDERAAVAERYKLREVDGRQWLYDLDLDPLEQHPLPLGEPALQPILAELRAVVADPLDRSLQEL